MANRQIKKSRCTFVLDWTDKGNPIVCKSVAYRRGPVMETYIDGTRSACVFAPLCHHHFRYVGEMNVDLPHSDRVAQSK